MHHMAEVLSGTLQAGFVAHQRSIQLRHRHRPWTLPRNPRAGNRIKGHRLPQRILLVHAAKLLPGLSRPDDDVPQTLGPGDRLALAFDLSSSRQRGGWSVPKSGFTSAASRSLTTFWGQTELMFVFRTRRGLLQSGAQRRVGVEHPLG
jgi:hypothetical protein